MPIFLHRGTFTTLIALLTFAIAAAQSRDTVSKAEYYKNIIKVNLTSNILYRAPQIEYERIVARNQSFSVQVGIIALPFGTLLNSDSIYYRSDVKKSGYAFTIDYRFYLAKENKDPAPHGVYIGPYVSYYHFDNERNLQIGSSPDVVVLNSKFNILSIGAQLGYQFVLGKKKRWTIDCIVIGPSLTNYRADLKLIGNIDPATINDDLRKILDGVASRFPLVGDLLKSQEAEFKGHSDSWNAGFRYSIHAGFRF